MKKMELAFGQRDTVDTILAHAEDRLAAGRSERHVREELAAMGLDDGLARELVRRARRGHKDVVRDTERRAGAIKMVSGVGLGAVGGTISAVSYASAGSGDSYVVMTGLIGVAIVLFLLGLFQVAQS